MSMVLFFLMFCILFMMTVFAHRKSSLSLVLLQVSNSCGLNKSLAVALQHFESNVCISVKTKWNGNRSKILQNSFVCSLGAAAAFELKWSYEYATFNFLLTTSMVPQEELKFTKR